MFSKYKEFLIKRGSHYCSDFFYKVCNSFLVNTKEVSYNVVFTDSCVYNSQVDPNININQLFGMSFGFHNNDSIHFGWNVVEDKIYTYACFHIHGEYKTIFITTVEKNTEYLMNLRVTKDEYLFSVNTNKGELKEVFYPRLRGRLPFWGYRLWPYFGDIQTAPHNITIKLEKVK
jgi:hypothetical protein